MNFKAVASSQNEIIRSYQFLNKSTRSRILLFINVNKEKLYIQFVELLVVDRFQGCGLECFP